MKIRTKDGHALALEVFNPPNVRYSEPVVMSTGIVSNRNVYKIDGDTSFVEELVKAGFIVVLMDWRGHGESNARKVTENDTFDKLVDYDVDAAIELVKRRFKALPHWIGHSMGGMAIMAYLAKHVDEPDLAKSITVIGSPTKVEARSRVISSILRFGAVYNNTLEKLRLSKVNPISKASKLLMSKGHLIPEAVYHTFFLAISGLGFDNVDRSTKINFIGHAVEPLFPGEMVSMSHLIACGLFRSGDKKINYRERFPEIMIPAFFIGGENDMLVAPQNVRTNYEKWGASDKACEIIRGFGHMGLLLGREVKDRVWDPTIQWLTTRSTLRVRAFYML